MDTWQDFRHGDQQHLLGCHDDFLIHLLFTKKTQSFTAMRCSSAVTLTASMIQNISCFSLVTFLVSVNNLILWPKAHSWSLRGWVRVRSHFRCTCLPVQLRILHQLAPRAETSSSRSECFVTFVIAINYLLTRGLVAKWNENRKL